MCEAENLCDEWSYISIVPGSLGSIKSVSLWYFDHFSSCRTDFALCACNNVTFKF